MPSHPRTARFRDYLATLRDVPPNSETIEHLLNGAAATELRAQIPLPERRKLGAFFTPHDLAGDLAAPLADLSIPATILDPCCGAGDLLLAALRAVSTAHAADTGRIEVRGTDIVGSFTQIAAERLRLQIEVLGLENADVTIDQGDGLRSPWLTSASHILVNPPFGSDVAPLGCDWASGRVNRAALFLAELLPKLSAGASLRAILPDVLRSGTQYVRWRNLVERHLEITSIEPVGRFDRWTDVDVFVLSGLVADPGTTETQPEWIPRVQGATVGDAFTITVGAVVNYRDPNRGPWRPYLTAKSFPTWGQIDSVQRNRRFLGRVSAAPFVAIPRTSRPDEPVRARGAIVSDGRPIAVDNHLLIATPNDRTPRACEELLDVLKRPDTTAWLNDVGRCRHLTVGAVASIPWAENV